MPYKAVQISLPNYKKGHTGQLQKVFQGISGAPESFVLLVAKDYDGAHSIEQLFTLRNLNFTAVLFPIDTPGYPRSEGNGVGSSEHELTWAVRVLRRNLAEMQREFAGSLQIVATVKSSEDLCAVLNQSWDKPISARKPGKTSHVVPEAAQPTAAP